MAPLNDVDHPRNNFAAPINPSAPPATAAIGGTGTPRRGKGGQNRRKKQREPKRFMVYPVEEGRMGMNGHHNQGNTEMRTGKLVMAVNGMNGTQKAGDERRQNGHGHGKMPEETDDHLGVVYMNGGRTTTREERQNGHGYEKAPAEIDDQLGIVCHCYKGPTTSPRKEQQQQNGAGTGHHELSDQSMMTNGHHLPEENAHHFPEANGHHFPEANGYRFPDENGHHLPEENAHHFPEANGYRFPDENGHHLPEVNGHHLPDTRHKKLRINGHNRVRIRSPSSPLSPILMTNNDKLGMASPPNGQMINGFGHSAPTTPQGTKPPRRRRREAVEVPAVATPCGTTAPERLGVRRSKVIMLGESGVGKTSIVYSYKYGPPPDGLAMSCGATIGASYTNFDMTVLNNVPVQLQLWDTAGQERFRCMVPMYMRNASAAMLVYDITNRASFEEVDRWHAEIARCPASAMGDEPVLVLIGNKADQHAAAREVAEGEGVSKALRLKAKFYEISAIDTDVIRAIFESVAEEIVRKCSEVDSAWEADEAMSGGEETEAVTDQSPANKSPLAAASAQQSPVIRLGWEPFRRELGELITRQISGGGDGDRRSWWWGSERVEGGERDAAETKRAGSSCCATL